MAGGLFALLDDVAAIAKAAAAGVDDVTAASLKASSKTVPVLIDDSAVTPQYVQGVAAHRELGLIKRIAFGSIRNKLLVILPLALLLSQFAEWALPLLLILGGCFLSYEGAEKVLHWLGVGHGAHSELEPHPQEELALVLLTEEELAQAEAEGPTPSEKKLIGGAVRTDLILSAEIMLISLANLTVDGFWNRFSALVLISFIMTGLVYGVVAVIVRMDDFGLAITQNRHKWSHRIGRGLVLAMPKVLAFLTAVGTAAMLWVGGHLVVHNSHEAGFHSLYELEHWLSENIAQGGMVGWLIVTVYAAIFALVLGSLIAAILMGAAKLKTIVLPKKNTLKPQAQ